MSVFWTSAVGADCSRLGHESLGLQYIPLTTIPIVSNVLASYSAVAAVSMTTGLSSAAAFSTWISLKDWANTTLCMHGEYCTIQEICGARWNMPPSPLSPAANYSSRYTMIKV